MHGPSRRRAKPHYTASLRPGSVQMNLKQIVMNVGLDVCNHPALRGGAQTAAAQASGSRPRLDEARTGDAIEIGQTKAVLGQVRHRLTGLERNFHRPARLRAGSGAQSEVHVAAIRRPWGEAEPGSQPS